MRATQFTNTIAFLATGLFFCSLGVAQQNPQPTIHSGKQQRAEEPTTVYYQLRFAKPDFALTWVQTILKNETDSDFVLHRDERLKGIWVKTDRPTHQLAQDTLAALDRENGVKKIQVFVLPTELRKQCRLSLENGFEGSLARSELIGERTLVTISTKQQAGLIKELVALHRAIHILKSEQARPPNK